jgi:hypothetical protein
MRHWTTTAIPVDNSTITPCTGLTRFLNLKARSNSGFAKSVTSFRTSQTGGPHSSTLHKFSNYSVCEYT